jgi:large subunit ribosomal protein L23
MNLTDVIKSPMVTEKLDKAREQHHQFSFLVDPQANKTEIRHAVERLFKVNVLEVRTTIVRGKVKRIGRTMGRRPNWKRAVVTLKEGQTIDLFETA